MSESAQTGSTVPFCPITETPLSWLPIKPGENVFMKFVSVDLELHGYLSRGTGFIRHKITELILLHRGFSSRTAAIFLSGQVMMIYMWRIILTQNSEALILQHISMCSFGTPGEHQIVKLHRIQWWDGRWDKNKVPKTLGLMSAQYEWTHSKIWNATLI